MKTKRRPRGFTLIELLVFTAVGSIVIVFLLSIIISFLKSRNRAQKLNLLQDTTVYIFNELTQEVHWSEDVLTSGSELTLSQSRPNEEDPGAEPDILEVNFEIKNGRFLKTVTINGITESPTTLSLPEIEVVGFAATNVAGSEEKIPLLEIELQLEYKDNHPKILSDHKTTISLRKQKLNFLEE